MDPLRFRVFDKTYNPLGAITKPREAHVTIQHNLPGSCQFTLDDNHRLAPALGTAGARIVAEYRAPSGWKHLTSGVVAPSGQSGSGSSTGTFEVVDDKGLLWGLKGWPNPAGTILQQGDEDTYYTQTGSAENVVKNLVGVNIGHVNVPLTIPTNLGRGSTITVSVRMHPLADRLYPAVDLAGIGVTVYQSGAGLVLDVYVPEDRTDRPPLTEASGVVLEGRYSITPPTVTRVVVAGPGEGLARKFARVINTAAEAAWGVSIEDVRDARDLKEELSPGVPNPDLQAELEARGQQTLDEGAAKSTLSARLQESAYFRAGVAYWIGDLLPVQLRGMASPVAERVRAIDFDLTKANGFVVTPHLGQDDTFESVTTRHIAALARGHRDQIVGR
ncbi:Gp37-like protein [Occultella kanbiaonis]|uniref:Gp37-like protein n=1 Tax=Occultella kanbiaonis TaxID=2675754 RepID=UPI0013D1B8BF|nr:hypothetical protein [Occultella kanbiaonis]